MTISKRTVQHLAGLAVMAASLGLTACSQIDINTPEGLEQALESRQKLDRAVTKISSMAVHPKDVERYLPGLNRLYMDGSSFDREVIQALALVGDPSSDEAFSKAADSKDYKQVIQAACGIEKTGNKEIQNKLLSIYDKQNNPEVKRAILESGKSIVNEEIAKKAVDILNGNLDETPFVLLRASCDVLAHQKDQTAVNTLMRVIYHQDGVGRSLTTNCTRALVALDKSVVVPALLTAYKLENKDLQAYVKAHPDTLTNESIRNNTVNSLALYRAKDAIEPILDYLGDTHTIPVPGTLAIRPNTDPAWQMWASLVGVAAQSSLFALIDIGTGDNPRAKKILTDIFTWDTPYKAKFKNAIELTGTTNIEVSQRVNAFRALRENDLITNEETVAMVNMLKGEEFQDERKLRNWARSSIGTDMVTYSAVTAKKGDRDTVWAAFNAMKSAEFNVPEPADPDAPKVPHFNDNVSQRIDDVKPAFELAETCGTDVNCYVRILKEKKDISNYERIKAIYEIGFSGNHDLFELVANEYKNLDVFGQLYGTKTLAKLGTKDDVPAVEALTKNLAVSMNQIQYRAAKPNLENLVVILTNKD